jgi:hypothetical protein
MPAKDRRSRRPAGYAFIEVLVVVIVLGAVTASIVALLVSSRRRLRRASSRAGGAVAANRAGELLARDIRAAGAARVRGGRLVLVRGRDRITWRVRKGRLVRAAAGSERVFRPPVTAMRAAVTGRFVEVGISLPGVKRARARSVYVGAAMRAAGGSK